MNKLLLFNLIFLLLFQSCAQDSNKQKKIPVMPKKFELSDYLKNDSILDHQVQEILNQLDDTAMVAQLLMPAIGRLGQTEETIQNLVSRRKIGGLLLLNGTKQEFSDWVIQFERMNDSLGALPFLYSADAEPSLVNRKIIGSTPVKKANELKSLAEVIATTTTISKDLNQIGINYNFSPVVDMSPNKTVGFRSFGAIPENIIPWSDAFIQETQKHQIIATAKHFPGHGLVSGDTHKSLQVIDGELKEIGNYPALIENGVLSIMVAHIAVTNNPQFNTNGLPSTLSHVIVQDLLRDSLNFKGLIVTDAMNMGGVANVPNAAVKAIDAGCDIVLMPLDSDKAFEALLKEYRTNPDFKKKVDLAVARIIRMKICAGLLNE
jgi:beta-N-acetylhexosaminidase